MSDYIKERNEALKHLSVKEFRNFVNEHASIYPKGFVDHFNNASDEVVRVTMHKMRANATGLSPRVRGYSKQWLEDRGYSAKIK